MRVLGRLVSAQVATTLETRVTLPRSTVRFAGMAVGDQTVATLPSTAASAYCPASSELAVAGRQRARSSVGVRSGRRVGIVAEPVTGAASRPASRA